MCLMVKYNRRFLGNKGWKLLRNIQNHYYTGMCDAKVISISKDEFTKADTKPIAPWASSIASTYPGGFHIFTRKRDALKVLKDLDYNDSYTLCKVKFRKQVAYGSIKWSTELPQPRTVVAQECRIIQAVKQQKEVNHEQEK